MQAIKLKNPVRMFKKTRDVELREVDKHGLFKFDEQCYELKTYRVGMVIRVWIDNHTRKVIQVTDADNKTQFFKALGETKWRQ